MSNTLYLSPGIVVNHVVQCLQSHLNVLQAYSVLPLFACVDISGRHCHERVQILCVRANEVQKAGGKPSRILDWREGEGGREEEGENAVAMNLLNTDG